LIVDLKLCNRTDFIKKEGGELEFSTVNPVAILGPALSSHVSGSFVLFDMLLSGKPFPNLPLNLVDVRDVADLHIRAMTNPNANGERFIAAADGQLSMREMALLIKKEIPEAGKSISSKAIPDPLIYLAALFSKQAKEGAAMLRINRNVSNEKAKTRLGWQPAANEAVVLASIRSMIKFGIIK